MAELTFSLAYGGPAVDDGTMDVRTLAPALLALADVFRATNITVNREAPPVTLQINATARGSFEVHLILSQLDFPMNIMAMLSGDQITAVANLFQVVGGTNGLFGFLKRLGGRKIVQRHSIDITSTEIDLDDGVRLSVPNEVMAAYQSLTIRKNVETVVSPLRVDGIESMEIRSRQETEVRIEKADTPHFRAPSLPPQPLLDTRMELNLKIVSVTFQEGNMWRFSDGGQPFFALMEDEGFMQRVLDADEAFRSGDILRVSLHINQEQDANGDLHTSYVIEKVLDHIPRERLIQLPIEPQ